MRTVRAATALEPKLDALAAGAAAMDDATFEREYSAFLHEAQTYL